MENVQDAAPNAGNLGSMLDRVSPDAPDSQTALAVVPASRRKLTQIGIVVGALLMMFVGQYQIFRDPQGALEGGSPFLMGFGAALLVVTLGGTLLRQVVSPAALDDSAVEPVRVKLPWLAGSLVLAAYASWRTILKPEQAYLGEHLLIWFMVMLTLIMAVLPAEGQPYARDKNPIRLREWLLIGVLLIAALALRVGNLGTVPYLMDQDEAKFANEGAALQQMNYLASPFEPGVDSHPRIFMMMISVSVGFLGPTLFAARLPSAIMAALAIPALYLLAREIYGWRVGLVAALFALPWSYQILFARLSMNQPADPLFATLAFYFLLRGVRRGALLDYVASGIFLGVAQMFYLGGRLAPVVMVSYLVYQAIRDRQVLLRQWRALLLIPLAALIVTLPQNVYLLYFHEPLSTRADKSILLNGELQRFIDQGGPDLRQYVSDQVRYGFGALIANGDRSGWYGRGSNVMGLFGGPLLILGIIASFLLLWKYPKWCIALGWGFTIIMVMCVFGQSPPQYERYFPGTTAYALLVGVGALAIALAIAKALRRPQLANPLLLVIGGLLFVGNLAFFTLDYVPSRGYIANRPNWITNRVASEAVSDSKAGRYVVLVGGGDSEVQNTVVMMYMMSGTPYSVIDGPLLTSLKTPNNGIRFGKPLTFLVSAKRAADLTDLATLFPSGTLYEVHIDEDGSKVFYIFNVDNSQPNVAVAS